MVKYNFELKLKIVHDYLNGAGGYQYLAQKHGVKNKTQVRAWIYAYKEFGEEGLLRRRQNQHYSVQEKLNAIELYQTSEMSYREVTNQLEMNNYALIANWIRIFRSEGIEGLSRRKGRPKKMSKKKENHKKKKSIPSPAEQERIQALEQQVHSLQIENAFLKELRKLRQQEALQKQMKKLRESSTASEKDLD